ncbi:MAG: serine/threonine protein kinase [Candidatus Heimdallarchaeota archaeon]|nr:serine/threonine protein kinase [Candidatus Heimdallarchaeota archaeon]
MSKAAENVLELDKQDFRILQAIEVGMRTAQYVSIESIVELSKLSPDRILNKLDNLHYRELIFRWKGQFTGYQLTHHGYDVLAFRALSERDTIIAFGKEIGKGKESDVFLAYTPSHEEVVAKIHRVGRPSFQRSKKLRSYIGDRGHINWLYKSRLSAEREYEGLKTAANIDVKVPIPIGINRHIIIMKYFEGTELVNLINLNDPLKIFNGIISEIRKMVVQGGIVHGDLSEYNIIITSREDFLLIDFPQFEYIVRQNSQELLLRDILNISKYFKRKYRIQSDPQAIYDVIMEEYEEKMAKKKTS